MKIITWNCNMVFRNKADLLLKEQPDIAVIPECEHPEHLIFRKKIKGLEDIIWYGNNRHKGLGVFSFNGYKLKLSQSHNPDLRTILPIEVKRGIKEFTLFAIWANNPSDRKFQYVGQVWKALHYYKKLIRSENTLLIGDFNSNSIWDKPKREGNHSTIVQLLRKKDIHSTYHHHHAQEQGKEKDNTLFMYRHKDKPYHIDYCFASSDFIRQITEVKIGSHRKWCKHSDHTPLFVTFNF